jgi:hypothetical protein
MNEGRPGRGGGDAPRSRVTTSVGHNRFVWDARHQNGQTAPPGQYQARLTVGEQKIVQPFNLLIDPNVAAEGVTAADLVEQFEHNVKVAALTREVGNALSRARQAQQRFAAGTTQRRDLETILTKLQTEPVRYGKPGLQAHISYLAGLTRGPDMKIGRDAISRYEVLRKELDAVLADLNRLLGVAE